MHLLLLSLFSLLVSPEKPRIDLKDPYLPVISAVYQDKAPKGELVFQEGIKYMPVYLLIEDKSSGIPLTGKYSIKNKKIYFTPSNRLGEDMEFEACLILGKDTVRSRFKTPSRLVTSPSASVTEIFPASETLPSNILLFYIEFSQPMNPDVTAFRNVKILDSQGEEQKLVWRQRSYWLKDSRVLVMMIHPGRVKRGLNSLSELGPVFKEGERYAIVVSGEMKDRYNRKITKEFRKDFAVSAPDRQCPAFSDISRPPANTFEPLKIMFSEGMDYASVMNGITVKDVKSGTTLKGEIVKGEDDNHWYFKPLERWRDEEYTLTFEKVVADFCGNSLYTRFEVEDMKELEKEKTLTTVGFHPQGKSFSQKKNP
jgi:hypothetical protein